MNERIASREWIIAIVIAVAATAWMQIPYIFGYVFPPADLEYTGLLINLEDYTYQDVMLQGYNGAWTYHIQYTTEPHAPAFIYGFYLFLGHLARLLNVSIIVMWHASRVVASLTLLITVFAFICFFLGEPHQRYTAYLLAIFGSGFDWVLFPWEHFEPTSGTPLDFRNPEVHLFFTALTFPHIAFGIVFILVSFWLMLKSFEKKQLRYAFASAPAILLVGITFPFLILLPGGIIGAYWLYLSKGAGKILWRAALRLVVAFGFSIPLYLYYAYVLQTNPIFRAWNEQAVTPSPNPLHYLLSYGAMLMLALPMLRREINSRFAFLWIWVIVVAILLYAPFGPQRRFVQGVQIPLAILTTTGLYQLILPRLQQTRWFQRLLVRPNYTRQGLERVIVALLLVMLSTANIVVLLKLCVLTTVEQPAAFFIPRAEVAAVDWLAANTKRSDAVLAEYWTSGYIPARSGNAVFIGQDVETYQFQEKRALVEKFFAAQADDAFRRDLLARYRIIYVFYGPRERALGSFDPGRANYLELVYANDNTRIYRVVLV